MTNPARIGVSLSRWRNIAISLLSRKKANKRRMLVLWPDFVSYGCTLSASRCSNWFTAMLFEPSKVSRIEITSTLFLLPLIIWLILYLAQRLWSVNLLPALPWVKTLRWAGWALGVALLLLSLTGGQLPWGYGIAMTAFSAGLSIPESWIKQRFLRRRDIPTALKTPQ